MSKAIGGYFELELPDFPEYYPGAVRLNSGRNALEYILLAHSFKKIYIPYFTCDVLLEPIERVGIPYEFYRINASLEPLFDYENIASDEAFLYTNYFGIKDKFIENLSFSISNLIIDNAQSFYSQPLKTAGTFYSPRKFFGLPDGSYVYCSKTFSGTLHTDKSSVQRTGHLMTRLAFDAEEGYMQFTDSDSQMINQPLLKMSALTNRLLRSINYNKAKDARLRNFAYLSEALDSDNLLRIEKPDDQVPMVYPFWAKDTALRSKLLEKRVFVARYWPNVMQWTEPQSIEYQLAEQIIPLPVDQRYSIYDMAEILKIIKH